MMSILSILVSAAVVLGVLYVLYDTRWVIVLLMVMFPLEQLIASYVPLFAANPKLFNLLIGVLAVVALASRFIRGHRLSLGMLNPVSVLIWLIYIKAAVGILHTPGPEMATSYMLFGLPYYVLMLLILPLLLYDLHEFRRLIRLLLWMGSVITILILVNPNTSYYSGRFTIDLGMQAGKEGAGSVLALGTLGGMLAIASVFFRPDPGRFFDQIIRLVAFVCGLGLAIGTGSRGQVLAAIVTCILFYPVARPVRDVRQFFATAFGVLILIIGFMFTFSLFVSELNRERWAPVDMVASIQTRFDFIAILFFEYLSHPLSWLFGLGTAAFEALESKVYVHNLIVEMLCEQGLVGLLLLTGTIYYAWRYGVGLLRTHQHDPQSRATVTIILAFGFYWLMIAMKQGSFLLSPEIFLWFLIVAKLAIVDAAQETWVIDETPEEPEIIPIGRIAPPVL
ncbi:MAG: hypothetical protein IID30_02825 [Planctomycetes bacterium]|nr:hypothetical protein [Planctomycetota bacterium]